MDKYYIRPCTDHRHYVVMKGQEILSVADTLEEAQQIVWCYRAGEFRDEWKVGDKICT